MANICIHCIISGLVQGVCYRNFAQTQARALAITGWVKNISSGEVEVLACGDEVQVNKFIEWLEKGPTLAKVEAVNCKPQPWQKYKDFSIVYG